MDIMSNYSFKEKSTSSQQQRSHYLNQIKEAAKLTGKLNYIFFFFPPHTKVEFISSKIYLGSIQIHSNWGFVAAAYINGLQPDANANKC